MATSTIFRRPNLVEVTDWLSGLTFSRYKLYQYSGVLYRCLVTHVAGPSFDGSKFEALSGIEEANVDGKQYARKDGVWSEVVIPSADQVSIDLTANTNGITAGNVVELVSTGGQNVQNIYHCEAPTIGSLVTLDGTNETTFITASKSGTSSALLGWSSTGLKLANYESGATNTGTVLTVGASLIRNSLSALSDTHHALSYVSQTNGNILTALVTVNASNIPTISTASAVTTGTGASIGPATCALTSSNWFVAYADGSSLLRVRNCISNTTNAPTLSLVTGSLSTNAVTSISLARTTSNTGIVAWTDSNASGMYLITSDGTNTPPSSAKGTLEGTNNCTYITQSPIDSNHTLCAYNNATTSNGMLAVIQANGTNAPTVISRSTLPELNTGYTGFEYGSLTAHSSNLHTLVGQEKNTGDGFAIPIYVDAQYNATFGQKVSLQGSTNTLYNAVAALTPTTAIAAFQGSGSDGFAGTLTLTPTPVISGQLVGIASTSATNGASATVAVGPVVTGTFTSGADYYASGAGGLTTTATPVHVLKAKSTTEGVLELRGAPEAGKQLSGEITAPGAFTWIVPYDGEYVLTFCAGGGSGAGNTNPLGGNGGNTVVIKSQMVKNTSITGSIGAGGATVTNSPGYDGGNSTVVIGGITYTAKGGRGGNQSSSSHKINTPNNKANSYEILGECGGEFYNSSSAITYGGKSSLTIVAASSGSYTRVDGTRGGGGSQTGAGVASGAGGDGVFRWELVIGS